MKVLFAVSNDNVTTSVINKYQQKYKEIVTSKNVYYFNAIVKELQRDKNYDAIIIEEDLEPISNNNYEAIDNFLFEKLDSISDEASKATGEDIPIIFICSDRRTKSDTLLRKLFSMSIYNALVGNDRSLDQVCELMYKPRNKKEAKKYYQIVGDQIDYESHREVLVSEEQIQNILSYYKRIGTNERKCVQTFDSIAKQYDNTQLRIIVKFLPMDVKAILEMHSPVYQRLMSNGTVLSNGQYSPYNPSNPRKPEKLELVTKNVESGNKLSRPVVIPSNMNFNSIEEPNSVSTNTGINQQPIVQPQAQSQTQPQSFNVQSNHQNIDYNQSNQYGQYNSNGGMRTPYSNGYPNPQFNQNSQPKIDSNIGRTSFINGQMATPYYNSVNGIYGQNVNAYRSSGEADNNVRKQNGLQQNNLQHNPVQQNNMQTTNARAINPPIYSTQRNYMQTDSAQPNSMQTDSSQHTGIQIDSDQKNVMQVNGVNSENTSTNILKTPSISQSTQSEEGIDVLNQIDLESKMLKGDNSSGDIGNNRINSSDNTNLSSAISESLAKEVKPLEPMKPIREETSLVAKSKAELKKIENENFEFNDDEQQEIKKGVKRRRGRPRKVKPESIIIHDTNKETDVTEIVKKRRGRPRKKLQNEDINADDVLSDNEKTMPVVPIPISNDQESAILEQPNQAQAPQESAILEQPNQAQAPQESAIFAQPNQAQAPQESAIFAQPNQAQTPQESAIFAQPNQAQAIQQSTILTQPNQNPKSTVQQNGGVLTQESQNQVEKIAPIVDDANSTVNQRPIQKTNITETQPINLYDLDISTTEPLGTQQNGNSMYNSKSLVETKNKDDKLELLKNVALAGNGKIVAFVGTSKNGISFIVNNLAQLLSNSGINTAVVDLTRNRNSYYMFTDNDVNKVKIATESLKNLSNGITNGLVVKNNLTVFTSLPDDIEVDNLNHRTILETLSSQFDVILLDCDYHTNQAYFVLANEIYLVQSMDALTIQPLTKFLSDLKLKNILDESKLKIVINKYLKLKKLDDKMIIGGMSKYNEPSMTLQRDLFNPKKVPAVIIPFDEQTYIKYIESVALCQFSLNGYSREVIESLEKLKNMVYPLIAGGNAKNDRMNNFNDYDSNMYTNQTNSQQFTNNINDTLNKMRTNNY